MKKVLFAMAFVAAMMLGATQPAFALHGGFATTGVSCSECHAVHDSTGTDLFINKSVTNANAASIYNGQTLQMTASSKTVDLCKFCHVYGTTHPVYQDGLDADTVATKTGYAEMAIHSIGATDIPNAGSTPYVLGADGLVCIDCHNALPHGAGYDRNVRLAGSGAPGGAAARLYAQDLKGTGATAVAIEQAMCVRCHGANNVTTLHGNSHPLTGDLTMATTNYGNQQVAWVGTPTCMSCHKAANLHSVVGTITTSVKSGVNYTSSVSTGVAFTSFGFGAPYGYSATAPPYGGEIADGQCASCHTDNGTFTAPSAGVGVTY